MSTPDVNATAERSGLFDRPLPQEYRDELRALLAQPPAETEHATTSVLLFRLGPLRLALPAKVAWAIAPVLHIARIPHRTGTALLGLAAFRGEILPCCSLARILDLQREETGTARTLILEEARGRRWAVPIDSVLGVRLATVMPAEDAPLADHWLQGAVEDAGGTFFLLDPHVLFRQITLATA